MPTSKTVNTQAMLSAGESGSNAVARAFSERNRVIEAGQQHDMQRAQSLHDSVNQHRQLNEQERGNQVREGLEGDQLAETSRRNRMSEVQESDKQDIEMADRGLERSGTSRADKLNSEMDKGAEQGQPQRSPEDQAGDARYADQASKSLEVAGPDQRTIAPTAERTAQEGSKLVTNRLNGQANYINAMRNYREAGLKGPGGEDAMKAEIKNLQQPIRSAAKMFDLGKKGDLTDSNWNDIKELAGDAPDPALQEELANKSFGPAMGRFLQNRVAQASFQFMAVTGDMPDGDLVDLASPAMQTFTWSAGRMQGYLRAADAGAILSRALKIQTLADRNRMVRKLTAQAMLVDRSKPKQTGGSLIPSQGGQNAIPAPGQQPGGKPNLKPELTDLPVGADPNQRPGSPVQQALRSREETPAAESSGGNNRLGRRLDNSMGY